MRRGRLGVAAVLLSVGCVGEAETRGPSAPASGVEPPAETPPPPPVAPVPVVLASPEVLAGRLARFIWDESSQDVAKGLAQEDLSTPSAVAALAERMLDDPRARRGVGAFYRWWMLLDILDTAAKDDTEDVVDAELRRSMVGEAPALGTFLTLDTPGTFSDLLTGSTTFVDERLARYYGIDGVTGPGFRRVAFPADQPRVGIQSMASVLNIFSSISNPSWPAKRGWLVTEQLLCMRLPRTFLPLMPPDTTRSIREQAIALTQKPGCISCHRYLDSGGFAFIGFDSFGRWRPGAAHGPGENRGWIVGDVLPGEPHFEDLAGLSHLLASRPEARRCFARQWVQFAVDPGGSFEHPKTDAPDASVEQAHADFQHAGFKLRALVVAVTRTEAFLGPATATASATP